MNHGITAYTEHYAPRGVELLSVPAADDPLTLTIRAALDARALGLSRTRTVELMELCGLGIDATEIALPAMREFKAAVEREAGETDGIAVVEHGAVQ